MYKYCGFCGAKLSEDGECKKCKIPFWLPESKRPKRLRTKDLPAVDGLVAEKMGGYEKKMAELKPCPFCGGKARQYDGKTDFHGVTCQKCSCKVFGYASAGAATRAWNRRAEDGK